MEKKNIYEFKATQEHERLDVFVKEYLDLLGYELSRSYLVKLIKSGLVKINGKPAKASKKIKVNDEVSLELKLKPEKKLNLEAQNIPLRIVYEDQDLLVVNKEAGLVVHPGPGHPDNTLVNAVLYHTKGSLSELSSIERPGIVHRLDKDTSGLIVVAKNNHAHLELARQFMEKEAKRTYIAVVKGIPKESKGKIETFYARNPVDRKKWTSRAKDGKRAITNYYTLSKRDKYSLLMLKLETGRTHQIRVHLSERSLPILGDSTYGKAKHSAIKRQALHAVSLSLIHPRYKIRQSFCVPIEQDMRQLIDELGL